LRRLGEPESLHSSVFGPHSFADTQTGATQQFSRRENSETVESFVARLERHGQDVVDSVIDDYQLDVDKARSYEDAANRVLKRHKKTV